MGEGKRYLNPISILDSAQFALFLRLVCDHGVRYVKDTGMVPTPDLVSGV